MFLKARNWLGTFYKYKYSYGRVSFSDIGESFEIFFEIHHWEKPSSREKKCSWDGREDKRVKERQKKGTEMVPKEKIRRKENTESTENNSILIQLYEFANFAILKAISPDCSAENALEYKCW